ncbi:MAG: Bax inhibitor-1 family protein [Candidatus Aenigmarchaeota archaeon]|nr:Bax inhibitor-1 family protein [Candidatus Aenigmarchaeota archaeon]
MEQKVFKRKVMPLFATTLVVSTIGSLIGLLFLLPYLSNIWVLLGLGLMGFVVMYAIYSTKSLPLLYFFNILMGALMAPILGLAIYIDPGLILQAFAITTVVFAGLAGYAYFSKKDFTFLGGMLFVLLIFGIVASLAVTFLGLTGYGLIISAFFTLLFAGFVLYDMSSILKNYPNEDYVPAVAALYIDFINLFINILMILINLRGQD